MFAAITDLTGIYTLTAGAWRGVIGQRQGNLGEAEVAISTSRPDTDWVLTQTFAGIGRTNDSGRTWIVADAGIDKTGAAFIAPLRKCPTNDDVFLTGTNRLWRTNNFFNSTAPSWSANSPPHPFAFPASLTAPGTILGIDFAPSDATCNTYAYGNRGGEVQLTTNGGITWKDLDPGRTLPPRPVNSIAFNPANPNVILIALSSFDEGTPGKSGHVFKTTNAQAATPSWVNISPPENQPFNVIAIDPRDPNLVYAGSDTGLWYSRNGGAGWQRFGLNSGLPTVSIFDVEINPSTNMIVAFTNGRGAYTLDTTAVPQSGPVLTIPATSSLLNAAAGAVYSQDLTAAGGSGPYTWQLSGGALPPGLALSPSGRIGGTPTTAGVFTFTAAVTDSAGGIASQTYSLTVLQAGTMVRSGVLAHIATGGGWTTVISLNNTSASLVTVNLVYHADDGSALSLPVTVTQQGNPQSGTASSATGVINSNATLLISLEDQSPQALAGWVDVLSTGPIGGFAIFRFTDSSGRVSEGTVPLQTQFPSRIVAPYDNTAGFASGLAIANLSNTAITVSATISDQNGAPLGVGTIALQASGHSAFYFPEKLFPTTGKQGVVTFQSSGTAGLTALGLRFSPFGTFTSVPITLGP